MIYAFGWGLVVYIAYDRRWEASAIRGDILLEEGYWADIIHALLILRGSIYIYIWLARSI